MTTFTIGADPEMFIKKPTGTVISAHTLEGAGTKENPEPLEGEGMVQRDGMALEFNTEPVVLFKSGGGISLDSLRSFSNSVARPLEEIGRKFLIPNDLKIATTKCVNKFSALSLKNVPDEFKALGCDPDMNAWTGKLNEIAPGSEESPYRAVGGHVHIGWCEDADVKDPAHLEACRILVKQLDYALGIYETAFAPKVVAPNLRKRRSMYGKAGAFRAKPYGAEYRTLSNWWIFADKNRRNVAYLTSQAIKRLVDGERFEEAAANSDIQEIINTGNSDEAIRLFRKLRLKVM